MLKDIAVERYRFTCADCGHVWSADFDVQHIDDGHGVTWEYFSLDGIPVPSPTAPGTQSCPRCGATWIHVQLMAVRTVPLAEAEGRADPARPRQRLDSERRAAHEPAPLLRGDQSGTRPTHGASSGAGP